MFDGSFYFQLSQNVRVRSYALHHTADERIVVVAALCPVEMRGALSLVQEFKASVLLRVVRAIRRLVLV
jgi:hypothetical protein